MPTSPEFVFYCIGSNRIHHHHVRKLLAGACEDIAVNPTKGAVSVVDLAVYKARFARSKVSGVNVGDVERVLGREAASALEDIHSAVQAMEEAFGLTAGPSRTKAQLSAAADVITPLLFKARDRFLEWDRATKDILVPGLMDSPPSIGEFEPYKRPTRSVPVVPPQLPGDQVARIVRTKLGIAFGMGMLTYGRVATFRPEERKNAALFAISDFAPIMAELGVTKDGLRRRGGTDEDTSHFVEMISIASDEIDRFYEFATERLSERGTDSYDALVAECKHTAQVIARVTDNADKLIARLGYSFELPEPEMAAPAP